MASKTEMYEHQTVPMKIKGLSGAEEEMLVDVAIEPIVRWLNGFDDVETVFSCQGEDFCQKPGVIFLCQSVPTIREIFKTIKGVIGKDIVVDDSPCRAFSMEVVDLGTPDEEYMMALRMHLAFRNKATMLDLAEPLAVTCRVLS